MYYNSSLRPELKFCARKPLSISFCNGKTLIHFLLQRTTLIHFLLQRTSLNHFLLQRKTLNHFLLQRTTLNHFLLQRTTLNHFLLHRTTLNHFLQGWQKPGFYVKKIERCIMCWIEWKIKYNSFVIFILQVIAKINKKLGWWHHKNVHNSKNKNWKMWNLIFLLILPIQDLSCKFDHFWKKYLFIFCIVLLHTYACKTLKASASMPLILTLFQLGSTDPKKNDQTLDVFSSNFFLLDKIFLIFFQKCSNFHEKFGMCWNKWKINFPIFIFWVMVIMGVCISLLGKSRNCQWNKKDQWFFDIISK